MNRINLTNIVFLSLLPLWSAYPAFAQGTVSDPEPSLSSAALISIPDSYGVIAGSVTTSPTTQASLTEGLVMQVNQQLKSDNRIKIIDVDIARTMNKQPQYMIRARILELPHTTSGTGHFAGIGVSEVSTSARVALEVIDMESFAIVATAEGTGTVKDRGIKLDTKNGNNMPSPLGTGEVVPGVATEVLDTTTGKRTFSFERFASSREGKALSQALKNAATNLYKSVEK